MDRRRRRRCSGWGGVLTLMRLFLFTTTAHFRLEFTENPSTRERNTGPTSEGQGVSFQKDGQENGKDFARRSHRTEDQRIEIGNGIKDETLSDGTANGKLDNIGHDFGVGRTKAETGLHFAESQGNDGRREAHEQVGPKHEIVRFRFDADLGRFRFETLLETGRDTVQDEGHANVKDTHGRTRCATPFLLAHAHDSCTSDNGEDLQVLSDTIRSSTQEERTSHDRSHLVA